MAPRRIKVAHVVTRLELGGAQQNTLHTVEHLDRSRFEPVLLCGRGAFLDAEAGRGSHRTLFIDDLVRPVRPWRDLRALFALERALRGEKPDIVHTHSSKAGILGRWAARRAGVPRVVHTFHGFGFNDRQRPWTRAAFVAAERATAKISDVLVCVSRSNRDEALARGIGRPDQYRLIRSGIALERFRTLTRSEAAPADVSVSPSEKLVTTVGPFKPQKNLLDFVRAAARVRERRPDARFLVVGDGDGREALETEVRRHRLENAFILPGWRRDIPEILRRTDVFVLTSLWEGLPRALVEAMASGLPCVANAVDGVRDVVADGVTGFLTPPRRPDDTADRVLRLLEDPSLARRVGDAARAAIGPEFDIDDMVRRQEALYVELTVGGAPPLSRPTSSH